MLSLVENAITHAFDARSNGRVSINLHEVDAGNICIKVIDNGAGIVPENLERIFDPFFTTRLGKGSSGLGLYVVYNIVTTVLDGVIEVVSTVGQGTCFTLTLPRVAKLEAALAPISG